MAEGAKLAVRRKEHPGHGFLSATLVTAEKASEATSRTMTLRARHLLMSHELPTGVNFGFCCITETHLLIVDLALVFVAQDSMGAIDRLTQFTVRPMPLAEMLVGTADFWLAGLG